MYHKIQPDWPNWQCYLAGCSKGQCRKWNFFLPRLLAIKVDQHMFFPETCFASTISEPEFTVWMVKSNDFLYLQKRALEQTPTLLALPQLQNQIRQGHHWCQKCPQINLFGVLLHRRAKVTDRLPFLWVKWLFWNRNLKTIPSEYEDILYIILKVLNRPLKWDKARLWTPTGSASTSHQSWTFEKNACFSTKTEVFFERSTLTAGGGRSSGSSETYSISF